jgi:hypothetical protein
MKRTILAFVVLLTLATAAFAKDFNIIACTKDHQKAILTVDIQDEASKEVQNVIKTAFTKAANDLDADALVTGEGFREFANNLTEEAWDAIVGIQGLSVNNGPCN